MHPLNTYKNPAHSAAFEAGYSDGLTGTDRNPPKWGSGTTNRAYYAGASIGSQERVAKADARAALES